ncbi:two-component sensor histidine kinase [Bordetella genomosp. 9]|uniref:sensor histidine kinase n=1 Tax=Bordetella genomosp. 9 TaxID=1416803 RepID=UPI000A293735|nr:sensor histidine kinase KdpD [Bordetella genomosp. 9]ARP89689.1 two-component sensor histidine kinase [Bordetella genomosp. 9]
MSSPRPERPDPDALLRDIDGAAQRAARGRLRLYFGASAGVGKTYAMLAAAAAQHALGVDVLAGVVETHGRRETAALLDGIPLLPRVDYAYRGHVLPEFDLDGALARRPALVLVDELAHSNAPGARHAKRWQDVEELLAAGIDVWSTLNAQHLDSLNQAVGSITGIPVWETVPDRLFDAADEVVLVDLPPDELLRRLRDGKVYLPEQARHAARNFFRKGNLIALRELALRRMAERVDDDVQAYRRDRAVDTVWRTREAVMACLAADDEAEYVVRAAHRLAQQLDGELHVVTVEAPSLIAPSPSQRLALQAALAAARELDARVETLGGADLVQSLVGYVRRHNVTKAVIGRTRAGGGLGKRWRAWLAALLSPAGLWRRRSFADLLAAGCPELDVIRLAAPAQAASARGPARRLGAPHLRDGAPRAGDGGPRAGDAPGRAQPAPRPGAVRYAWACVHCAVATALSLAAFPALHQTNIAMFYLLAVMAVALRHGRGPAALASVISVAAFDFFFVQPTRSFAVSDVQYLVTFFVLLTAGLLIGQLTAGLRQLALASARRESVARGLYEFARELSSALMPEQIAAAASSYLNAAFGRPCALLLAGDDDRLGSAHPDTPLHIETALAQWVSDHGQPAGCGTGTLSASPLLYLPLKAPMRTRGVLVLEPPGGAAFMTSPERPHLDAYATLIAIAIERVHYVQVAQQALVNMASEQLRSSLLSAISHDLRTPLTSLVGMTDTLMRDPAALAPAQRDIVLAMREQTRRMHAMVVNLLDMARLQNREVALRKEWQSVEELVGAAIAEMREPLRRHHISVAPLSDLPLVECDGVLMQRVLCNLLENAAKYTPPCSHVHIDALPREHDLLMRVADDGPGIPAGQEKTVFEKFVRGERESATPGAGLGLAVCQAIMQAHQGRIWVEPGEPPYAGARFVILLPLGQAPAIAPEPPVEGVAAAAPAGPAHTP